MPAVRKGMVARRKELRRVMRMLLLIMLMLLIRRGRSKSMIKIKKARELEFLVSPRGSSVLAEV
jgi:hypothetical protein